MKKITIQRSYFSDCTTGRLWFDEFQCFTLELPWKDNKTNISCIPHGLYHASLFNSPHNGACIAIRGVTGRSLIEIHSANFTRQILGCIAVGDSVKFLDGDSIPDITNSKATLKKLLALLPSEFLVEIK